MSDSLESQAGHSHTSDSAPAGTEPEDSSSGSQQILGQKVSAFYLAGWSLLHHTPGRIARIGDLIALRPVRALRSVWNAIVKSGDSGANEEYSTGSSSGMLTTVLLPLAWIGRLLFACLELIGIGEILQLIWNLIFGTRRLRAEEETAFLEIFPELHFRLDVVRVHPNSPICRINGGRAVTSFYLIHLPDDSGRLDLMVHELSHALQYETVGGIYMFEALYAQFFGEGYNYGDLAESREHGLRLPAFNREQQAQICQDYYRILQGKPPFYSGSEETLRPYITDWRSLKI